MYLYFMRKLIHQNQIKKSNQTGPVDNAFAEETMVRISAVALKLI